MFHMRKNVLVAAVVLFLCFGCENNGSTIKNVFKETHPLFGIKSISIIRKSFLPGNIEVKNNVDQKEVLFFDKAGRLKRKVELKYLAPDWERYNKNITLYAYEYF